MPISRDARMDRRRRLLRDSVETDHPDESAPRRGSRRTTPVDDAEGQLPKRKAGYSQDVRRACGQRLVQFIPVRRRSYIAVAVVSFLIPAVLLGVHYLVHVTAQLPWWRHPLAVALDIGHPRSLAAWLCGQLWMLCLGATILTFQLRRHKLDDYKGEYRLWFWLVLTCLIASVDSTTSISDLFALALDPWAQTHLGWSGPAVVDLTLAVLIGMLGLRMCSELKEVPLSLLWWLGGLVAWACSAALARPEFQLSMSAPVRYWLIFACWLGGLTMIWLAALTYLRYIYIEAQQRFLLRGGLASSAAPLRQRLRQSLPSWPRSGRLEASNAAAESASPTARRTLRSWALPAVPSFMKRGRLARGDAAPEAADSTQRRRQPKNESATESNSPPAAEIPAGLSKAGPVNRPAEGRENVKSKTQTRWTGWLRRPKDNDDATEYHKVRGDGEDKADTPRAQTKPPLQTKRRNHECQDQSKDHAVERAAGDNTAGTSRRRWLPKLSLPSVPKLRGTKLARPKLKLPTPKLPKLSRGKRSEGALEPEQQHPQEKRGVLSRLKIPKFGLSALKLQPPTEDSAGAQRPQSPPAASMRPVAAAQRPLPSTQAPADDDDYYDDDDQDGRPLSKAERKRLRRNQQQQRRSA